MPPRKPGLSIPEAQRHTVGRKLRLSPEASGLLDQLSAANQEPASRVVETLLADEAKRRRRRRLLAAAEDAEIVAEFDAAIRASDWLDRPK